MAVKNRLAHLKGIVAVPSIFVYELDSELIDKVFSAQQERLHLRHHLLNTHSLTVNNVCESFEPNGYEDAT